MNKDAPVFDPLHRRMQCFGEFNVQDPICRQVCALRIRCAVEYGQQGRMEMLEEMFGEDEMRDRIH